MKRKSIVCTILSCLATVCFSLGAILPLTSAKADGTNTESKAYYVSEDRETRGMWYTGADGLKKNRETNRVYGKTGAFIPYQGYLEHGHSLSKYNISYEDNSETFKLGKDLHYVEYPTWLTEMDCVDDGGMNHWNDPDCVERVVAEAKSSWNRNHIVLKMNLFIDYNSEDFKDFFYNSDKSYLKSFQEQMKTDETLYTQMGSAWWLHSSGSKNVFSFEVSDDNWHAVTVAVGKQTTGMKAYAETKIELYDLGGNPLMSYIVKNSNDGVYTTFAVKGSFMLSLDGNGYDGGSLNGIYFDDFKNDLETNATNLTANHVQGTSKEVELHWENSSDNVYTNIYRREVGQKVGDYEYIATVAPGIETYTDSTGKVSRTYEYALSTGTQREYSTERDDKGRFVWDYWGYALTDVERLARVPDVKEFNCIDETNTAEVSTAPYRTTSLQSMAKTMTSVVGEEITYSVRLYESVVFDDNGNFVSGTPMVGYSVRLSLSGEYVFWYADPKNTMVINPDLGTHTTDENGVITLKFNIDIVGSYTLTAEFEELPDANDPNKGYDGAFVETTIIVSPIDEPNQKPVIFDATDAIKPGDSFVLQGAYIGEGNETQIAFAPANGQEDRAFSWSIPNLKFMEESAIITVDYEANTSLSAIFPSDAEPGVYDIWVKNGEGWSTSYTINTARALYITENGGYEGLPLSVVGRNFLLSEIGAADDVAVKFVRVSNLNGVEDGNNKVYKATPDLSAVRYTQEESVVGKKILANNTFRVEVILPAMDEGIYDVYVSNVASRDICWDKINDGERLSFYQKKTQDWVESIFGSKTSNSHIGNDPLDLQVWWAQNFKYNNVTTVPATYRTETLDANRADEDIKATRDYVNTQIATLSSRGGGILYFPDGYYYLSRINTKSNVLLVGESREGTVLVVDFQQGEDTNFFINQTKSQLSYFGFAKMTLTQPDITDEGERPARMWIFDNSKCLVFDDLALNFCTANSFSTDTNRGAGSIHGSHIVVQKVDVSAAREVWSAVNNVTEYFITRDSSLRFKTGCAASNGARYSTYENNVYIEESDSSEDASTHGIAIRDTTYCQGNAVYNVGSGTRDTGDGETILCEPPSTQTLNGKIMTATARTVTIYRNGGEDYLNSDTVFQHTDKPVIHIYGGKGAGQIRHLKIGHVGGTATLELADWEEDWDVIPDHTSVFTIYEPNSGNTILDTYGYDNTGPISFYYASFDCVAMNNELVKTWGIKVDGVAINKNIWGGYKYRIENNTLDQPHGGKGSGGIGVMLTGQGGSNGGTDMMNMFVVRNNTITNMRYIETNAGTVTNINAGIFIANDCGVNSLKVKGALIENNYIENCEYGIYVTGQVQGVFIRGNSFKNIGEEGKPENGYTHSYGRADAGEYITLVSKTGVITKDNVQFIVKGEVDNSFGDVGINEALPAIDDKHFIGWSLQETATSMDDILLIYPGNIDKVYAIFGHTVSLQWNYEKDGSDRGEWRGLTVFDGQTVTLNKPTGLRPGYTFEGWYLDKDCTQVFNESTLIDKDYTLYAKWTAQNSTDSSGSGSSATGDATFGGCNGCNGCNGSVDSLGVLVTLGVLALSVSIVRRKYRKER